MFLSKYFNCTCLCRMYLFKYCSFGINLPKVKCKILSFVTHNVYDVAINFVLKVNNAKCKIFHINATNTLTFCDIKITLYNGIYVSSNELKDLVSRLLLGTHTTLIISEIIFDILPK